ncbi:hypothetical protein B0I33_11470 [Prauserella shujinwangii]|uniref:Excreted virulence factor EspC (Type VII ESX diderm) n=1 Tax=Prauserella shujinwangii TaxID=1453103 RepID=A0A2T0LKX3_9PSEU|nr:hypothetical protein [Prauserella shujinwangii]PRX43610.1 hypothetical protein B0I33_11470 [Prauserella shujinwangii]
MDGTPHRGFWVDEGAYDSYARAIDPVGDDLGAAGAAHVAPHAELAGDGFSAMGTESGFAGAYATRMRALSERLGRLGGDWRQMADAARRTSANYAAVEADQQTTVHRLGEGLR